jgi:hypothetical protein
VDIGVVAVSIRTSLRSVIHLKNVPRRVELSFVKIGGAHGVNAPVSR